MDIHVVQPGENIYMIADTYDVSATRLIQDNGIDNPYSLVPGQTIVIVKAVQSHTVKEGETLAEIAKMNNISLMQLLRNNPFLSEREFIYPGENLAIKYETGRDLAVNAYAYPYIHESTLKMTLPYLTYLSINNYSTIEEGNIISYGDDSNMINLCNQYGTIPLMMISTLSSSGEPNLELAYNLLLNEEYQNRNTDNMVKLMREKGYKGANMVFSFLNSSNQHLYKSIIQKVSSRLKAEGFLYFITINTNIYKNNIEVAKVDYSEIEQLVDGIIIVRLLWGLNKEAPAPISSDYYNRQYLSYLKNYISPEKLIMGIPIVGYEWELPFISGKTSANSLTFNSILSLASDFSVSIQFDEESQTPYFEYYKAGFVYPTKYIVWFTDARSMNALSNLVSAFGLGGTGVWNIMVYSAQLWLILNSRYQIIKLIPDNIE